MHTTRYDVLLAAPTDEDPDAAEEHRVRVIYGDQLRAELEAPRHGLAGLEGAPMHYTALWIWAALSREGKTTAKFQEFKHKLLEVEPVQEESAALDPTQTDPPTGSG